MPTHILIVDDDPLHAKLLSFLLEEHGYAVSAVADSRAVAEALRQRPIDLVLAGVDLPRQDGFALTAALKRAHPDTPVVICAARRDTRDLVEAFAQGADDYVARPYEPAELVARVQAVLRRYRRAERRHDGVLVAVGDTRLDLGRLTFTTAAGRAVPVTPTEMRILEWLMLYSASRSGLFVSLGDADPRPVWPPRSHASATGTNASNVDAHLASRGTRQWLPASKYRCRNSANPARPYMLRFTSFSRVICPST